MDSIHPGNKTPDTRQPNKIVFSGYLMYLTVDNLELLVYISHFLDKLGACKDTGVLTLNSQGLPREHHLSLGSKSI